MSLIKRRAFNILAASSAVLLVLTAAVCIAASIVEPKFTCARNGVLYEVGIGGGHAWLTRVEGWPQEEDWERVPKGQWNYFTHYQNLDAGGPSRQWSLGVPWGNEAFVPWGGGNRRCGMRASQINPDTCGASQ